VTVELLGTFILVICTVSTSFLLFMCISSKVVVVKGKGKGADVLMCLNCGRLCRSVADRPTSAVI